MCAKVCRRKSNKVTCVTCNIVAHSECVGLGRKESAWQCKRCVEATAQEEAESAEASCSTSTSIIPSAPSLDVMSELTLFRTEQGEQNRDVGKSLELMHNKVNDINLGLDSQARIITNLQSMVENLQSENEQLKMDVSELKMRVGDTEQYSRRNTIEMQSSPYMESTGARGRESPQQSCSLCESLRQALGAVCSNDCIDGCIRFKNRVKKCVQCFLIGLLEILAKCVL